MMANFRMVPNFRYAAAVPTFWIQKLATVDGGNGKSISDAIFAAWNNPVILLGIYRALDFYLRARADALGIGVNQMRGEGATIYNTTLELSQRIHVLEGE